VVPPVRNPEFSVGDSHIDVARTQLRAFGIPIVAQRTGGKSGLVVNLNAESGEVLVRRVPWKSRAGINWRDSNARRELRSPPPRRARWFGNSRRMRLQALREQRTAHPQHDVFDLAL
jgi:hypothetical protein